MPSFGGRAAAVLLALLALASISLPGASAKEQGPPIRRVVGEYEVLVSYSREPLLEVSNALLIEVREVSGGAPVANLESSISVLATAQREDVTRPLPVFLRPRAGEPGSYEGVFVPPVIGRYEFRVLGDIRGTPIDEKFISDPGGLPDIKVADSDFTSRGALIAIVLLVAFLVGLAVIAVYQVSKRRQRTQAKV